MRRVVLALFAIGSVAWLAQAAAEPEPVVPKEKISLFNGRDFTGWKRFIPGQDVDVNTVWTVADGVIQCVGKPNGYMRTEVPYADYRLHVEWRWPAEPGNSGVLVHMSEPDKVWPKSIECQLAAGNAGDFWVIDGTEFVEHLGVEGRRVPKKQPSSEKPAGEWNAYDITCKLSSIRVMVNGVLQNEATGTNVTSGRICLQSEGRPIEFRNVTVEPVG